MDRRELIKDATKAMYLSDLIVDSGGGDEEYTEDPELHLCRAQTAALIAIADALDKLITVGLVTTGL